MSGFHSLERTEANVFQKTKYEQNTKSTKEGFWKHVQNPQRLFYPLEVFPAVSGEAEFKAIPQGAFFKNRLQIYLTVHRMGQSVGIDSFKHLVNFTFDKINRFF